MLVRPSKSEKSAVFCTYSKARSGVELDFLGRTNVFNFTPPGRSPARAGEDTTIPRTTATNARFQIGDMNGFLSACKRQPRKPNHSFLPAAGESERRSLPAG